MTFVERHPPSQDLPDLGLVGDGDVHAIVRDLERAFGVDFDGAFATWRTVGDIEEALFSLYPPGTQGACASTMAFYTLRRAFADRTASPKTKLAALRKGSAIGAYGELERDLGLRMPAVETSAVGLFGQVLLWGSLLGFVAIAKLSGVWWLALAGVVSGAILVGADRGSFGARTLGDLARDVALFNYGAFAARGADRRAPTLRHVLRHIVCRQTRVDPDRVGRETRLFAP